MTSSNRAEWENFVGSPDIQPLGRAYGYQLELPFEEQALFNQRINRFFDDPRNIRGLFGDISVDEAGQPRPLPEAIQRGIEVKRGIRNTPKLMQDLNRAMNTSSGGVYGAMAGLEDAYSLRQLFGEAPGEYGSPNPSTPSTERRGVNAETGGRVRVGTGEPTSELSPAERTAATSASFRPSVLSRDIGILGSPEVVVPSYPAGTTLTGLDAPAPLRALDVLDRAVSGFAGEAFDEPIQIDATRNYDNEWLRSQTARGRSGIITIANELPGEFAENLQTLLRQPGADPDYIYDSLRELGTLPDESRSPAVDWDENGGSRYYEGPRLDESDLRSLASELPEQRDILVGRSGSGSRISKTDLLNEYGRYLPVGYKKLSMDSIQDLQNYLNSLQDPNAAEISRNFARDVVDLGPVPAIERAFSGVTGKIQNKDKQYAAADYLGKYLEDLDNKMADVPVRSAGAGGGEYLSSMDLEDMFPSAARKLEFFARDRAYVPDDFEPTVSETFYSSSGVPYKVEVNRDPAYGSLDPRDINENVAALLNDKPYAGLYNIDFSINGNYSDVGVPDELKQDVMNFVKTRGREGIPAGAVIRNAPLTNESSRARGSKGNKRSLWYQQLGFGANTPSGQFGYIDPDTGDTVPIQPYRSDPFRQGTDTYKRSYFSLDPVTPALRQAVTGVRQNPFKAAGGAAMTLLNDEVAKAIEKDDYKGAGVAAAKDVLGGAALEAGAKAAAKTLAQRAPAAAAARILPAATKAARVGIPAAVGTGLFMQGRTGSALDTLTNKAATVVPGLRPNPQTDVGRRAGKAISNEAKYLLNSVLQNRVPYLGGRLF